MINEIQGHRKSFFIVKQCTNFLVRANVSMYKLYYIIKSLKFVEDFNLTNHHYKELFYPEERGGGVLSSFPVFKLLAGSSSVNSAAAAAAASASSSETRCPVF